MSNLLYLQAKIKIQRILKKNLLDKIGIISATICAVHCLALPIFMVSGSGFLGAANHWLFDVIFISMGLIFIYTSIFKGYKKHQQIYALGIALIGVVVITIGFLIGGENAHLLFATGGILWVIAHFLNMRLTHKLQH